MLQGVKRDPDIVYTGDMKSAFIDHGVRII